MLSSQLKRNFPNLILQFTDSTHHATSLVVVEIHQVSQLPRFLETLFVWAVNKSLGKIDSIPQVVTAMCHKITRGLNISIKLRVLFQVEVYKPERGYFQ